MELHLATVREIGRLVPEDVIGLIRYLREHAASATGSCRLTSRVAPSGICLASRARAWAANAPVRSMVTASSPSARRSRPRIGR